MDITIYLPDDLGKWAKEHSLGLSRMLRDAVEAEKRRTDAITAAKEGSDTHKLEVQEPDGYGGSDEITVRFHGTLIAKQDVAGYGGNDVYLGQDGKVYVHDFQDHLHRDVEPGDLREYVDEYTYIEAMRALGEEVVIDVGLAEE